MFMKFTESSSITPTYSPGWPIIPSGGYGGTTTVAPKWLSTVEYAMFIAEIILNVFIVFLNVSVFAILWRATKPEYKACFYIIMRTFTCFVAANALGSIVTMMDRTAEDFEECWYIQVILIINMFTCIASSIWLFYAGLNRMMVLVWPNKVINAWGCWIVRGTLTCAALLALVLSIVYQKMCGVYTRYDAATNTIQMMASDMAEPLTIAVYVFPLSSIVFYVVAYNNLREKRLLVTSDKTKAIIDKAERKTLKIGMLILVTYTASLCVHLIMVFVLTNETFGALFNRIDEIVSCAPQVALPMALLSCNRKLIFNAKSSSSVSHSGTVQDLYTRETITNEKKSSMKSKTSTASNF
uniref:G_PROTEIN_RECEP_F1_2 domain-containing protein n=1 Tax=Caenorhabditis tropicalis TaxID=1561998 RepID=A0A1I7U404_9PELO